MVKFSWVGGNSLLTGTRVPRPVIGPFDFADDRAFLVLSLIVLDRHVARGDPAAPGHDRADPASGARQRAGRPVDRHLARPRSVGGVRRVGVHRRPRRGAAEHPPGERELREQLHAVLGALLAGRRRHARVAHRRRSDPGGGRVRAVRRRRAQRRHLGVAVPWRRATSPSRSRSRRSGGSSSSGSPPSSSPATPRGWWRTASGRRPVAPSRSWRATGATAVRRRCRPPRSPTGGSELVTAVLAGHGIRKTFSGIVALDDLDLDVEAGRARRSDRSERRRQDDVLQLRPRCAASGRGTRRARRRGRQPPAGAPSSPARHRSHLPAHRALRRARPCASTC